MKLPFKLLPLILVLLVCADVSAQPKFPGYSGHVNDFANVVEAATKQQLETILTNFERISGAQIAVATVPTLNERPIEEYANGLFRAWGVGAKSGPNKDKGALLLVAPNDRKSRLEVGYVLEGDLPDGLAGEMLRRMRPFFQQQQWSQGLTVGTRTLVDTLAQKWNLSVEGIDRQYAYQPPVAEDGGGASSIGLLVLIIGLLLVLFIISRMARRGGGRGGGGSSDWWAAPTVFNSGGGGFGSGSWGSSGGSSGGDSGGGGSDWGGFGGGSSGGGGASDSW